MPSSISSSRYSSYATIGPREARRQDATSSPAALLRRSLPGIDLHLEGMFRPLPDILAALDDVSADPHARPAALVEAARHVLDPLRGGIERGRDRGLRRVRALAGRDARILQRGQFLFQPPHALCRFAQLLPD